MHFVSLKTSVFLGYTVVAMVFGLFCCFAYPLITYTLIHLDMVHLSVAMLAIFFISCGLAISIPSIVYGIKTLKEIRAEVKTYLSPRERLLVKWFAILIAVPAIVYVALCLTPTFLTSINELLLYMSTHI